jgi:hypothetical protein
MTRLFRWLLAMAAPFMLASCILTPTKFVSTLDIRADRSFTFTYVGEVQLARSKSSPLFRADDDLGDDQSYEPEDEEDGEPLLYKIAARKIHGMRAAAVPGPFRRSADAAAPGSGADFSDSQEEEQQLKALAEMLSKEYGFRSVKYVGNRTLAVDYAITGTLDHAFIFPFHPDGDVILPFIAIELRGKDRVRIKAPGYANQQNMAAAMGGGGLGGAMGGMNGGDDASALLDGSFTLTTNAEIVSQNQEDGPTSQPGGGRKIVWRATPQTKDAPMAVLRLNPLP